MSSSVFPENIEPQITSIEPAFFGLSKNISLILWVISDKSDVPFCQGSTNIVINCFMENRQQQILTEIKTLAASVRSQMETLESKIAELRQIIEVEDVVEPYDVVEVSDEVETDVMDIELSPDTEFYTEPRSTEPETLSVEEEPAAGQEVIDEDIPVETEAVPLSEQVTVETAEEVDDDLPFFEDMPAEAAPAILIEMQAVADVPVIDAMLSKHAWRTDMPGTAVRDIRSAISLNDRILFINFLFNEDPMAFQETLTKLNSMTSFDEAATYMMSAFPLWDWESDTVYRFMMALRRRLQ